MGRVSLGIIILLIISCAPNGRFRGENGSLPAADEIVYLSSDLANVAVFSKRKTRFGPTDLTISNPDYPSSPAEQFETDDGVQCWSIGPSETSVEYAIKRPIKLGEQYSCLRTNFRVVKCFDDCKAAIIEMKPLSSGPEDYMSFMYVDNCRGVIILSVVADLREGIPLNAEWLRSEAGILAHPDYPKCRPF